MPVSSFGEQRGIVGNTFWCRERKLESEHYGTSDKQPRHKEDTFLHELDDHKRTPNHVHLSVFETSLYHSVVSNGPKSDNELCPLPRYTSRISFTRSDDKWHVGTLGESLVPSKGSVCEPCRGKPCQLSSYFGSSIDCLFAHMFHLYILMEGSRANSKF